MSPKCCVRCAQYCVFTVNFVVWVSGMVMLIGAIYLRMDSQVNHVMTAAYADHVRLFHWFCYFSAVSGAVITFVGFLGCCSAYQESRCMLATFFVVLFALFTAEVLCGVWVFLNVEKIKESIPPTMAGYVRNIYGKHSVTDEPVDYVQQSMRCCGGLSSRDWATSSWSNQTHQHRRRHRQFLVPESCCFDNTSVRNRNRDELGVPQMLPVCRDQQLTVADLGCGGEISRWLDERLLIIAIVAICLLGLEFASLLLTLVQCCALRRQSAGGYKT